MEAAYQQRWLHLMAKYFYELKFFDEELWTRIIKSFKTKHIINNLYYLSHFYETLLKMNKDPSNPFF